MKRYYYRKGRNKEIPPAQPEGNSDANGHDSAQPEQETGNRDSEENRFIRIYEYGELGPIRLDLPHLMN